MFSIRHTYKKCLHFLKKQIHLLLLENTDIIIKKKNNDGIKSISKFAIPHWICELTLPDGSKVDGRAVHYSLPEEKGCAPFITQHEGVISKIILLVGEFSEEV